MHKITTWTNTDYVAVFAVHSFMPMIYILFIHKIFTRKNKWKCFFYGCLYYAIVTFNNKFKIIFIWMLSHFFFRRKNEHDVVGGIFMELFFFWDYFPFFCIFFGYKKLFLERGLFCLLLPWISFLFFLFDISLNCFIFLLNILFHTTNLLMNYCTNDFKRISVYCTFDHKIKIKHKKYSKKNAEVFEVMK